MRLPTFSRVTSRKMRAPAESSVRWTAGSLVWPSKPGCASVRRSPVRTTCLLDQQRRAAAFRIKLGAERWIALPGAASRRRGCRRPCGFPASRCGRGCPWPWRVLHARQLHDDAVGALLLDDRFGNAEFVDAVVQGGDVLLDREFANGLLGGRIRRGDQFQLVGPSSRSLEQQVMLLAWIARARPRAARHRESAAGSCCPRARCRHGACGGRASGCAGRRRWSRGGW
jgi:hypothetical protein